MYLFFIFHSFLPFFLLSELFFYIMLLASETNFCISLATFGVLRHIFRSLVYVSSGLHTTIMFTDPFALSYILDKTPPYFTTTWRLCLSGGSGGGSSTLAPISYPISISLSPFNLSASLFSFLGSQPFGLCCFSVSTNPLFPHSIILNRREHTKLSILSGALLQVCDNLLADNILSCNTLGLRLVWTCDFLFFNDVGKNFIITITFFLSMISPQSKYSGLLSHPVISSWYYRVYNLSLIAFVLVA